MVSRTPSISDHGIAKNCAWKFSLLTTLGIFIIQLIIPNVIFIIAFTYNKYGQTAKQNHEDDLWLPFCFVSVWSTTNPFSRSVCENFQDKHQSYQKYVYVTASGVLCSSLLYAAQFQFPFYICYAIFAGIAISFIESQLEISCFDDFQSNLEVLQIVKHVASGIGIFTFPYSLLYFKPIHEHMLYLFAIMFVLIVAAGILLGRVRTIKLSNDVPASQTIEGVSDEKMIELFELPTKNLQEQKETIFKEDDELYSNSSFSAHSINEDDDLSIDAPKKPPRVFNKMGIEILPEIVEEKDDKSLQFSDEDFETYRNSYKADGEQYTFKLNLNDPHIFSELKRTRNRMHMSPYTKYKCSKRWRRVKYAIYDNLLIPFIVSIQTSAFYPVLISNISVMFASTSFLMQILHNSLNINDFDNIRLYLLPLIGLSCMSFLFMAPWRSNPSALGLKIIFLLGLLLSVGSFTLRLPPHTYFNIPEPIQVYQTPISCLLFGVSYGLLLYFKNALFRRSLPAQKWNHFQDALEVLSGLLTITIYSLVYTYKTDHMLISIIVYMLSFSLWLIVPVLEAAWTCIKLSRRSDSYLTIHEQIAF